MIDMTREKLNYIFEYIVAIAVVLNSNSIWNSLENTESWFPYLVVIFLYIGFLGYSLTTRAFRNRINKFLALYCICAVLLIILFLGSPNASLTQTIKILLGLLPLGIIIYNGDELVLESFFRALRNVIFFIALLSLVFWFVGSFLKIITPTGTYYSIWGGLDNKFIARSYYGIYWETQSINFFNNYFIRNSAIFTEAPMAAYCFSIAFMIDTLLLKDKNHFETLIIALAIITTFSTMGYAILMMASVYTYILNNPSHKIGHFIKVLIVPVLVSVIAIVGLSLYEEKLGTYSGSSRIDDYVSGISAWLLHPILGDGIGSIVAMKSVRVSWRQSANGFNNAFTSILVQGGCC